MFSRAFAIWDDMGSFSNVSIAMNRSARQSGFMHLPAAPPRVFARHVLRLAFCLSSPFSVPALTSSIDD